MPEPHDHHVMKAEWTERYTEGVSGREVSIGAASVRKVEGRPHSQYSQPRRASSKRQSNDALIGSGLHRASTSFMR